MTASRVTIIQLADILTDYLTQERFDYMSVAARLREVTGNKSVVETCRLVAAEIEDRAPSK